MGDQVPNLWRNARDGADGAGTRALGSAEGFADEVGEISGIAAFGFGDLNEHGLYGRAMKSNI